MTNRRPDPLRASNVRLSLLLVTFAVLLGFVRHLGVYVVEVFPKWTADTLTSVGSVVTVVALVLAFQAYRAGERETRGPVNRS